MNNADRHLTDQLRTAANAMPEVHVDLDAIEQATQSSGRHRDTRTVLLAVAAVVLAVALPFAAIALVHRLGANPGPATTTTTTTPTATSTPTATQSSTPTSGLLPTPATEVNVPFPSLTAPTPKPKSAVTFSLADLPTGAAPAVPYYNAGEFYPAGGGPGTPIKLAADDAVVAFGRYGAGWVATVDGFTSGSEETRTYDAEGNQTQAIPATNAGIARGTDGSVAVSMKAGQITLVDAGGTTIQTWQTDASYVTPVSVLPDHSVVFLAMVNSRVETLRAMPDGSFRALTWGQAVSVNRANLDLSISTPCTVVVTTDPAKFRWSTCPYRSGTFSPDGKLVAGFADPATIKSGDKKFHQQAGIAIMDAATGTVKVLFSPENPKQIQAIRSLVWEDDTHILALLWSNATGTWYPVRFGLDGSVEKADTVPLQHGSTAPGNILDRPTFESQTPAG